MDKRLKIWELSLLIALCFSLCVGTWAEARHRSISDSLLRLHVIAVSDDAIEQQIKMNVRDAVLDYMTPRLETASDVLEAGQIIQGELHGIKAAAEKVSCGRAVSVTLSEEYYPTREYDSFSLPAGRYRSLRVILGEGEGHNWWCVIFPPLCVSAAEQQDALDAMSDDVRGLVTEADGYQVKFRIVELWDKLIEYLK